MDMKKIIEVLKRRGYAVSFFEKASDAAEYLKAKSTASPLALVIRSRY